MYYLGEKYTKLGIILRPRTLKFSLKKNGHTFSIPFYNSSVWSGSALCVASANGEFAKTETEFAVLIVVVGCHWLEKRENK